MKILSFGASTSSQSINQQFAYFVAQQVENAEVTSLNLRELNLPMYSEDKEKENGIPEDAKRFIELLQQQDGVVVSLAEHNGSYTAAFKNLYDWCSRVEKKVWCSKPMLLLSTSPGGRGGQTVMEAAKATFPRMGADLKATFSLPSFCENFSMDKGVLDEGLNSELNQAIEKFSSSR